MQPPVLRFTVKHMLITMAVLTGIAVSVTPLVTRARAEAIRRATAEHHSDYAGACLRRVPVDLERAFVCGNWALEGREGPIGFVNDASCSGMCNAQQFCRAMLMDLSDPAVPGVRNPNFRGWVPESIWWAAEAVRDAARAGWHASMSNKYEVAAAHPTQALFLEPPEPFPDM
jgi:hypothetical protein